MTRPTALLARLVLVALVLSVTLSVSLARSQTSSLLTPTSVPPFGQQAYMPLLRKTGPPATPTPGAPASATATAPATPTATPDLPTATGTISPTSTSTIAPSATATTPSLTVTSTPVATPTAEPSMTSTTTGTPPPGATSTAAPTTIAPGTATSSTTATSLPSPTATAPTEPTATSTVAPSATATTAPTLTTTATASATTTPGAHQFTLSLTEQLQWYTPAAPGGNYDIVIVQDYSYSMRYCWESGNGCATGTRRIDYAAASLRSLVNELLVTRTNQGGENRLAYVTFSQSATLRIPFMDDTTQALAAFKTQIGDVTTPRTIPNADLPSNANTADAMVKARIALASHRTVDSNGNPVGLAIIILTDDVANVFNDAGYERWTNNYNTSPFFCGETAADNQNPLVQWTCPSRNEFPAITPLPLPPMKAAVAAADANRAAHPTLEVFAVALGNQFSRTVESMHLHEVAPNHAFAATAPGMLPGIMATIEGELGDACRDQVAARRPASGADVVIRTSTGVVVAQGTTASDGTFSTTLAPGSYTVAAQHLNVVAPADPLQIARDYTVLQPGWNGPSAASVPLVIADRPLTTESANLAIASPASATCP